MATHTMQPNDALTTTRIDAHTIDGHNVTHLVDVHRDDVRPYLDGPAYRFMRTRDGQRLYVGAIREGGAYHVIVMPKPRIKGY